MGFTQEQWHTFNALNIFWEGFDARDYKGAETFLRKWHVWARTQWPSRKQTPEEREAWVAINRRKFKVL